MELHSFNQFIGEAGIFSGDLTSLSIKALNRAKNTKAYKILEFIFESGENGRRYTDIVKFIVEDLNGDVYNHEIHRGWWAANLLGGQWSHRGLLYLYCKKLENGRWKVNDETTKFFESESELYKDLSQKESDLLNKLMNKRK